MGSANDKGYGHGNGGRPRSNNLLASRGGPVETAPAVYIVFWGSQWGTNGSNDPAGEAPYLQSFLGSLSVAGGDHWSTSTTQYCQGVAAGTTNCSTAPGAVFITHPAVSPLLGVWYDSALAAPGHPSQSQLAAEAQRAATYFSGVPGWNPKAQFVVATSHGNSSSGFGVQFCAWHSSTSSAFGAIGYTNLPYQPDAGAACGANFVNAGSAGALDGVSIVGGHEYAETITDPFPNSGWLDTGGAENGDKCAWISSGQGAATNIPLSTGTFAVQSLWSNQFNTNQGGCVTAY